MSRYRHDWNFGTPTARGARDREQAARRRLHQEGLPGSLLGRQEMRDSYRHMKPSDIPVEQPTKFNLVIRAPRKIPLAKSPRICSVIVRGHGRMERAGHGADG